MLHTFYKIIRSHISYPILFRNILLQASSHSEKYSKEEELLRERKRLSVHGITSYQVSTDNSRVLFPATGSLFVVDLDQIGRVQRKYSIRTGIYLTVAS